MRDTRKRKTHRSILVVDDDRRLLSCVKVRLDAEGYRCIACSNASEALLEFSRNVFDLVITDVTMPDIDGLSVIALIRCQSSVPIIVVTGHVVPNENTFGAYEWITFVRKPFDAQMLLGCIARAIPSTETPGIDQPCGTDLSRAIRGKGD